MEHTNLKYSGSVPIIKGDRWYAQDFVGHSRSFQDYIGKTIKDTSETFPCIMTGGIVSQGVGDTLNISLGIGYAKFSVEIMDSFASTPPTKKSVDVEGIRIAWTAQTNLVISSATLDGVTVNYVKAAYVEANGSTRIRAKDTGTYSYITEDSFTISVDATPNTDYEVLLATFTGVSAGSFTFDNSVKSYYRAVNTNRVEHNYTLPVKEGEIVNAETIVRLVSGKIQSIAISTASKCIGSIINFEPGSTNNIAITALTEDKALVAYRDVGNSDYGTVCLLKTTHCSITASTPVVFKSANTQAISLSALSSSKALIAYADVSDSQHGKAIIVEIADLSISMGAEFTFEGGASTLEIKTSSLTETRMMVTFRTTGSKAIILDILGTTITAPTAAITFDTDNYSSPSITSLSEAIVIVAYADTGSSNHGKACFLGISGTTITAQTPVVFQSTLVAFISIAALTETKAIVTYVNAGNSNYGTTCVLSIIGTTIIPRDAEVFDSVNSKYTSVIVLNSNKAVVFYNDGTNTVGKACVLGISETTITPATPEIYTLTSSPDMIRSVSLTSRKTVIIFLDDSELGVTGVIEYKDDFKNIIGIAKETQTGGNPCEIADLDKSLFISGLSGLTPDTKYYVSTDGTLSDVSITPPQLPFPVFSSDYIVGIAESSTTIKIIGKYDDV